MLDLIPESLGHFAVSIESFPTSVSIKEMELMKEKSTLNLNCISIVLLLNTNLPGWMHTKPH